MRAIRTFGVAGLLAILAIAGATTSVQAASGSAPKPRTAPSRPGIACPATGCVTYDWNVAPSANPNTAGNFLWGVTSVSASDAWAVGSQGSYPLSTLIERYDGRSWHAIASPDAAGGNSRLYAVAAVSSTDVWAVGYSGPDNGCYQPTLIEHWNGSVWSIVPSPDTSDCLDELNGITAISSADIWAVGRAYSNSKHVHETLILHWDGTTWSIVPSPTPSPSGVEADSTLQGVTAVSASDVWAVGSYNPYSETFTLTEHWNGSQWSIVPSPSPNTFISELRNVSAVDSNDVWAVGDMLNYQTNFEDMLIEHWNGSTWQTVPHASPCAPNLCGRLYNVFARSAADIWAVGVNTTTYDVAVIMHWNGANWSVSSNPPLAPSSYRYGLLGVSATSATHALATGYCQQSGDTTLTETLGPPQFPMKGPTGR